MKLKIELQKVFDTGLAARVIEQPEYELGDTLYKYCSYRVTVSHITHFTQSCLNLSSKHDSTSIAYYNSSSPEKRDEMHDFILEAVEHINKPKPLTFERIKSECVPMKHLLVNTVGSKRLYLGFNRNGRLVTDSSGGNIDVSFNWIEDEIKNWTIEEYKE